MATKELGQILGSVKVLYDDVVNADIFQPVGNSAYNPQGLAVDSGKVKLNVFDVPATFQAKAGAGVSIAAAGATISPFGEGDGARPPDGSSAFARLSVTGDLAGGGNGSSGALSLSAAGAASLAYNHYVAVRSDETRLSALTRLIATAQLAQTESLATVLPGEASTFEIELRFDLGLKAKYGSSFDIAGVVNLFDGLTAPIKAKVQYGLEASLGWSLFDDMSIAVGRVQQDNPAWVRVRIDRQKKNQFTAGATFALQVDYDASSIGTALEKAFDMTPLPRAIDTLRKVATTSWADVQAQLTDRAFDALMSEIDETGWREKLATDPTVTRAIGAINQALTVYNDVDDKVKQLWSDLLLRVDLGPASPVVATINKIAALDPASPNLTQFLSASAQRDLEMLEALTGKNVEELLIGSSASLQIAISKAIKLARQAQGLITGTPDKVKAALQKFTKEHGIQAAVDWLSTNATSVQALENLADGAIKNLVTKATGKLFSEINEADVKKVQAWAQRVVAEWDELSAKLAAASKKLKGTVGFNVALEFSRASEFSAVLDFEVNPADKAAREAIEKELRDGNIRTMLNTLDSIGADAAGNLPYTIRESVVISRHLRTGVTTVILSLLGLSSLQKVSGTRLQESVVRTTNTARTATYTGGFTQAATVNDSSSECAAWIASDALDDRDQTAQFDNVSRSFRLTFGRRDPLLGATERAAVKALLTDLGFMAGAGAPDVATAVPESSDSIFTIDIGLDEAALRAFVQNDGEENWNRDYRNAAYRLLQDDLVDEQLAAFGAPRGDVLADVVKSDLFGQTWTDSSQQKFIQALMKNDLRYRGGKVIPILSGGTITAPYIPLGMAIRRRDDGFGRIGALRAAFDAASADLHPDRLDALSREAASFFAATSFPEWKNPMFNFWFVIARLSRLNVLTGAKGLATLRFRANANADYSAPLQWTLQTGIGVPASDLRANGAFPFLA